MWCLVFFGMWQEGGQELMVVSVAMDVAARKSGYMYDAVDLVTKGAPGMKRLDMVAR